MTAGTAPKTAATALLEVEGFSVFYGAVQAVRDASLRVREREVVALLGANGAGKSSLLNGIMGLVPHTAGAVRFDGADITRTPTEDVAGRGLTLVFEGRRVFPTLTVRENLRLGRVAGRGRTQFQAKLLEMEERFPILAERRHQLAGTLSGGEQQMLAIARALMSSPKMVLLDEPSLGLAPKIVDEVFEMIAALKRTGVTLLLVEQNVEMGLEIADRAYVMKSGAIVEEGDAAEIARSGRLAEAYVGAA